MAALGPYVRTLDVPEPLKAPNYTPIPKPQEVEVEERELVPVRRRIGF
jgi:hypothetical protein